MTARIDNGCIEHEDPGRQDRSYVFISEYRALWSPVVGHNILGKPHSTEYSEHSYQSVATIVNY